MDEFELLRLELRDKDFELQNLRQELQKTLKRENDLEDARRAMLYMLEDLNESYADVAKAKKEWETTFDAISDPIFISDEEFDIIKANTAFTKAVGIPVSEIIGKHYSDFFPKTEDFHGSSPRDAGMEKTELEIVLPPDRLFKVRFYPFMHSESKQQYVIHVMEDITERKHMEKRIEYLAYYDALTELPNRSLFIDRLTQTVARAEYEKRLIGVLSLNLDRFNLINDAFGPTIGDLVLKEIARRLSTSVREGDTVARLGSDEFGIVFADVAHAEDIILLVEKIIKTLAVAIEVDNKEILITASIGLSIYPNDGKDPDALMQNTDTALSKAKEQGGNNYQFYTPDMNAKASEFVSMKRNLFNALKNDEYVLYYQPYFDINTRKMAGIEALIRWQSKDRGLVPPGEFIPVLEETKMIIDVGEWILRTAMSQVKGWQNNGYPVVPVSVNLSVIQFRQKDLAEMVNRIIREAGFYPSLLTLEITESAFMRDIEITSSVLRQLKDTGVSISIDDFGTGYSSLAYLKRFPIDNLKIDISFVREVVNDPDSASIVMAIIGMAHTLNLKTIAEGIETEEQWNFLRLLRCDMGQGFYLSNPLPAEEVERFFKQQ